MRRFVLLLLVLAGCAGEDDTPHVAAGPTASTLAPRPTVPPPPPPEGGLATFHQSSLAMMLMSQGVATGLGLTPEQAQRLKALDERFADRPTERLRSAAYVEGVLGLLDEKQLDLLTRMEVRTIGASALIDPSVRERIGLDQAQRDRIVALIEQQVPDIIRIGREAVTPSDRQASQQEVGKRMAELTADMAAVMTPEQAAALAAYGRGDDLAPKGPAAAPEAAGAQPAAPAPQAAPAPDAAAAPTPAPPAQ